VNLGETSLTTSATADLLNFSEKLTRPGIAVMTPAEGIALGIVSATQDLSRGSSQYIASGFFTARGITKQLSPNLQQTSGITSVVVQQSTDMSVLRMIANQYLAAQAKREEASIRMAEAQSELTEIAARNTVMTWSTFYGEGSTDSAMTSSSNEVYGY
jgi:hypothetical protein